MHITLGIFYRLFELLEMDCHQLDLCLAQGSETVESCTREFWAFMKAKREAKAFSDEIQTKKEQLKTTEQLGSYLMLIFQTSQSDARLTSVFTMATELRRKIDDLVRKECVNPPLKLLYTMYFPLGPLLFFTGKEEKRTRRISKKKVQKRPGAFCESFRCSPPNLWCAEAGLL